VIAEAAPPADAAADAAARARAGADEDASVARLSWVVWAQVAAVVSSIVGVQWDIAWHRSVGRDAFWSPPHVAIYAGGVLAGLASAWAILSTTFARRRGANAASSVRVFGFRGPLGAFIAAWGGVAMIASAPFDNWWHNAYGLDVKILSPPHTVLALGIAAMQLGALILLAGMMNRSSGARRQLLRAMYFAVGGMMLVAWMTFEMEFTWRAAMHSATFYRVVAMAAPVALVGLGRAAGAKWGATAVAGVYSAMLLAFLWIFPLVPATPKLGPVYYPVTHLIPEGFPLLLLFPAIAIDVVLARRVGARSPTVQAAIIGVVFVAAFAAAQWPFADLLNSKYAYNWFFGSGYFDYQTRPTFSTVRNVYYDLDGSLRTRAIESALAVVAAMVAARIGLSWGAWMRRVKR
jgi:hypothetical protein